ncbi:MAG: hypothetical protein ACU85U_20595 [Gammaproteobacteria bacterium]
MADSTMLDRLVNTLKRDIAPAIDDEYLKTQAFMASVVVGKLTRQLALESEHRAAAEDDMDSLLVDVEATLETLDEPPLIATLKALAERRDAQALCAFIEAVYAARARIGESAFERLRGRTRVLLRADIDRRMVYAK